MADIDVHNANRGEIIIYRAEDNTIQLDVRMENETVWLTAGQMAQLFGKEESNIRRHIINVFRDEEVERENNVHFLHVNGVPITLSDYIFSSPSTAAAMFLGGNANGWTEWKNNEGKTLSKIYRKKYTTHP